MAPRPRPAGGERPVGRAPLFLSPLAPRAAAGPAGGRPAGQAWSRRSHRARGPPPGRGPPRRARPVGRDGRVGRVLFFLTLLASLATASPAVAAWPGKNDRIVWTSAGDLWSDRGRLTATDQEEAQATWSPVGFQLAYTVRLPGSV